MSLLDVSGLTKRFGGLLAVERLDLSMAEGEMLGLIGPNGAGKTTVFNLLSGYLRPDEGQIRFGGRSVVGLKPDTDYEITLQVGATIQHFKTRTRSDRSPVNGNRSRASSLKKKSRKADARSG